MYKLCATEKSVHQQREFETALLALLQTMPYEDITISGLCQKAGYSRKVFYRQFEKKGDVLLALLDHTFQDFFTYEPDASVGEGGLHRFFGFWKEQKPLLDVLKANGLSALLSERALAQILYDNPEFLRRFGDGSNTFGREIMVFFLSGLFSLVMDWHDHNYEASIDKMSNMMMSMLYNRSIREASLELFG